eukprot:403374023
MNINFIQFKDEAMSMVKEEQSNDRVVVDIEKFLQYQIENVSMHKNFLVCSMKPLDSKDPQNLFQSQRQPHNNQYNQTENIHPLILDIKYACLNIITNKNESESAEIHCIQPYDKTSFCNIKKLGQGSQAIVYKVRPTQSNIFTKQKKDLTAANILLNNKKDKNQKYYISLSIADFGLSTFVQDLKNNKQKCGTPGYMAPESLRFTAKEALEHSWFYNIHRTATISIPKENNLVSHSNIKNMSHNLDLSGYTKKPSMLKSFNGQNSFMLKSGYKLQPDKSEKVLIDPCEIQCPFQTHLAINKAQIINQSTNLSKSKIENKKKQLLNISQQFKLNDNSPHDEKMNTPIKNYDIFKTVNNKYQLKSFRIRLDSQMKSNKYQIGVEKQNQSLIINSSSSEEAKDQPPSGQKKQALKEKSDYLTKQNTKEKDEIVHRGMTSCQIKQEQSYSLIRNSIKSKLSNLLQSVNESKDLKFSTRKPQTGNVLVIPRQNNFEEISEKSIRDSQFNIKIEINQINTVRVYQQACDKPVANRMSQLNQPTQGRLFI